MDQSQLVHLVTLDRQLPALAEPGKRTGIFKRCFLFDLAQLLASGLCSRHATALPTHPQAQEYDVADGLDSQLG